MGKKIVIVIVVLCLLATAGLTVWGFMRAKDTRQEFSADGYVLQSELGEYKRVNFNAQTSYLVSRAGKLSFEDANGQKVSLPQENFVHFNDNSALALTDGVLLDFDDLSENFINNYMISARLPVTSSDNSYIVETANGTMTFGENLWKLSENNYMIQSASNKIFFSDGDKRDAGAFVQVFVTDEGLVHLITADNSWATVSQECYIETAGGVRIYPLRQLIDDGTYRMSLAKIAVDPDQAIVLTEDETKRQVVPDLNFETIDGEDGADGAAGQAGAVGLAGTAGQVGTVGTVGGSGKTGSRGSAGNDGIGGGTGSQGNNAVMQSTTNSALPVMNIIDWKVGPTGLAGEVRITDSSSMLGNLPTPQAGQPADKYAIRVKIINDETGEVVTGYSVFKGGDGTYPEPTDTDPDSFSNLGDQDTFAFSTGSGKLNPDTRYRLSITGFYASQSDNTVYSREFVSRYFYTDSAGVFLNADPATTNSVNAVATVATDYQSQVNTVIVYLLTPEQNDRVISSPISDYTARYVLSYDSGGCSGAIYEGGQAPSVYHSFITKLPFEHDKNGVPLPADTQYIARVSVTAAGLTTLTRQELRLTTLKVAPTWNTNMKPTAEYNRATGAIEVYRPNVTENGGAVKYIYTAYKAVDGSKVVSREVMPQDSGTVNFFLDADTEYTFQVELVFNDNEKQINYDLGMSDPVSYSGGSLPHLTLTATPPYPEFNRFKGTLQLELSGSTYLADIQPNYPLTLRIFADQIYDRTIVLTGSTEQRVPAGADSNDPVFEYSAQYTENSATTRTIDLDLNQLYHNTLYTITVSGFVDLQGGDGTSNRYSEHVFGTVTFRTPDTTVVSASWGSNPSTTFAFSRTLKLGPGIGSSDPDRIDYAENSIENGKVTIELSYGSGANRQKLSSLTLSSTNSSEQARLARLFTEGEEFTEEDFPQANVTPDTTYTLEIKEVTDYTGLLYLDENTALKQYNAYTPNSTWSTVVTATPTPPDLSRTPNYEIDVTPILNKNAGKYGGTVDPDLPEDTLVGYVLQSRYDNSQRLGRYVTYYPFEYRSFFNAVINCTTELENPVLKARDNWVGNTAFEPVRLRIETSSDTVPGLAVLFGREGVTPSTEARQLNSGLYVYQAAPAEYSEGVLTGLGRGYRYLFAYTVEYSLSEESLLLYPYDMTTYTSFKNTYGIGAEYGNTIGRGKSYALSTGMLEAPKVDPEFHTYVNKLSSFGSWVQSSTTGVLELYYSWRDVDGAINTDPANMTQIRFMGANGRDEETQGIALPDNLVESAAMAESGTSVNWYKIQLPFFATQDPTESVISPVVELSTYIPSYRTIMQQITAGSSTASQDTNYYLCRIRCDRNFASRFDPDSTNIQVQMDTSHFQDNYIDFILWDSSGLDAELGERACAMKVSFQFDTDDDGIYDSEVKTFNLRVDTDTTGAYYARLATGVFNSNLVGKRFKVDASVYYDSGYMGWELSEINGQMFVLQNANQPGNPSSPYGTGYTISKSVIGIGNDENIGTLRGTVKGSANLNDNDEPVLMRFDSLLSGFEGTSRYLYPGHWGVISSYYSEMDNLGTGTTVPKKINEYKLSFTNNMNAAILESVVPTLLISGNNLMPNSTGVLISHEILFYNYGSMNQLAGEYVAYARVYDRRENAVAFTDAGMILDNVVITLNPPGSTTNSGHPKGSAATMITSPELEQNKEYYLVFYMKSGAYDEPLMLIDYSTAEKAIYRFTTSTDVVISSELGAEYHNRSYFSKDLELTFGLSRTASVKIKYSIVDSTGAVVLTDEQLEEKGLFSVKPSGLGGEYNHLTINLSPRIEREDIVPGRTYGLKLEAFDGNDEVTVRGSSVYPFTIPPVSNYGALIYVKNATHDEITYQVTVNDVEFSYMGNEGVDEGDGLYAVRFTDENGNWIPTVYDGKVYRTSVAKRIFKLNDTTIIQALVNSGIMDELSSFRLNVYAVVDAEHNGLSSFAPDASSGSGRPWQYFFTGADENAIGQKFGAFLNTFWVDDLSLGGSNGFGHQRIASMNEINAHFNVGSKLQRFTGPDDVLVNMDAYRFSRLGTTVKLVMEESFGLLSNDTPPVPAFKKIVWTVDGRDSSGTPFTQTGESNAMTDGQLFNRTLYADFDVYDYVIANGRTALEIPVGGSYRITVQFFVNATDAAAAYTFSGNI